MLFTVGDSTVRNQDKDENGQWGWGSVIAELGVLRTVHLQGAVFHFGTVRALCGSGLFRMEKVAEPDDGTGI